MDDVTFTLSILSSIVASISIYISQFKKGKIVIPPIRAYRLVPLNFTEGEESYRSVRMYIMLTFMNTGAQNKALHDLRVRVNVTEQKKDLILEWENEAPSLHSQLQDTHFATQPTLAPYESTSKIYTFINDFVAEQGKLVMAVEKACDEDENKTYPATLEVRNHRGKWKRLCRFAFRHSGRNYTEQKFSRINGL